MTDDATTPQPHCDICNDTGYIDDGCEHTPGSLFCNHKALLQNAEKMADTIVSPLNWTQESLRHVYAQAIRDLVAVIRSMEKSAPRKSKEKP